jgi:hypothetical protein
MQLGDILIGVAIGAAGAMIWTSRNLGSNTAFVTNTPQAVMNAAQSGTVGVFSSPQGFISAYQSVYGQNRMIGRQL